MRCAARTTPRAAHRPFLGRFLEIFIEMNASKLLIAFLLGASTVTAAADASSTATPPYTVKDGNKVDTKTLNGWKTWRALACERCHGANQEGLVGPPLVESLKKLTKEEFHTTVMNGRPEKGMPPFSASKMVTDNWEGLYAYLKGRSDGKIKPGHVYALDGKK
jgi:mono/diheme cytochrome c family protein